jgi:signal transduction histidine kinase
MFWVLLAHALLTYPDGRTTTAAERWFLRAAYAMPLVYLAALMRTRPEWLLGCEPTDCPTNPVQWQPSPAAYHLINGQIRTAVATVLGLWFVVLLVLRRRRMSPAQRRTANPVLWATAVPLAAYFYGSALTFVVPDPAPVLWTIYAWANPLSVYVVPFALLVGFYVGKLARADVATLLIRLRRADPADLRPALAQLLRDPSLEIAVPATDPADGYVDPAGRPVALPGAGDPRVVTDIGSSGVLLLHHQSTRDEDPHLFAAAIAAAAVMLENARLTAQVRAQLADVSASRERLVRAADDERRRVERDLHDGAQQQLIGVGMTLQSARLAVPEHSPAAQLLDEASGQLRESIVELRALARGLRPVLLTERGLAVALADLRRRVPVPVSLAVDLPERLDPTTEMTAYFVVAECLQNVTRHAPGARVDVSVSRRDGTVVVRVRDDGPGGADDRAGSGLRGLADRVAAAGGVMTVTSPVGQGTIVAAELPDRVGPA